MDEVQCSGNEASIFDCPHQTTDNCAGTEGLGVICSTGNTIYVQRSHIHQIIRDIYIIITLVVTLVGGSGPQEGNIMVHGQPVCDDGSEAYRDATARVVCRFIHVTFLMMLNN